MTREQDPASEMPINQAALIGLLNQQELVELDARLFPLPPEEPQNWAAFVRRERLQREAAIGIELCSSVRGFPVCTSYDHWPGADAYLRDARALRMSANLTHFESRRPGAAIARRMAYDHASRYLSDHGQWYDLEISKDDLKHFLGKNLLHVMSVARAVADREYQAERSHIIAAYLPGLVWQDKDSTQSSINEAKITRRGVDGAGDAIGKITYSAPIPDFFNLRPYMNDIEAEEARSEVIAIVGQEVYELCELMQEIDPKLLRIGANRTGALGYLPIHELQMSINTNPDIPPADICKAFLRAPRVFRQKLTKLQAQTQRGLVTATPELTNIDLSAMQIPNLDLE